MNYVFDHRFENDYNGRKASTDFCSSKLHSFLERTFSNERKIGLEKETMKETSFRQEGDGGGGDDAHRANGGGGASEYHQKNDS